MKTVSQRNQPFYPIRPQMMSGSVLSISQTFCTSNEAKLVFRGLYAQFQGTEVAKMVSQRNEPFYTIRPQTMLEIVSQHFAYLRHVKRGKTYVFGPECTISEVPKLRKLFRKKINDSTPLDPKRCLRVFCSISQTFSTSNEAKLVFRACIQFF